MPEGRRKSGLQQLLERLRTKWFVERVLPFTEEAAARYGSIVSDARKRGRAISIPDGQIAAVAAVQGFAVATRDTRPFEEAGVEVVNPWKSSVEEAMTIFDSLPDRVARDNELLRLRLGLSGSTQ